MIDSSELNVEGARGDLRIFQVESRTDAERMALFVEALTLIAAPKRPDGTWNRDRAACQELAIKALKESGLPIP